MKKQEVKFSNKKARIEIKPALPNKTLKETVNKSKENAIEKEKKFFEKLRLKLDLSNFPSMYDIVSNAEVSEWITKIVWYLLYRDGEIFTLTVAEHNLIESFNEKESKNYNKIYNKLQDSFKKNKGKSIKEYVYHKEYYNTEQYDENFNNEEDDYQKHSQYDKNLIPDGRIDDVIDKLQILLFGENGRKGFFEVFYDEYGEIGNAQEEFINFCKKIIRENVFVSRYSQNQNSSNKKIISFEVKEVSNESSTKTIIKCIKKGRKDIESENLIVTEKIIRVRRDNNIIYENINSVKIMEISDSEYDIEIEANPEIQKKDIIEIVETSNMKSYSGRKKYLQEDEENINYEKNEMEDDDMEKDKQEYKDMNNKLENLLSKNNEEVNNTVLEKLLQNSYTNKTKEIKKYLIIFYIDYNKIINENCLKSPDDMTIFTLLRKYFDEKDIEQLKKEIQNVSAKQKKHWLKEHFDPLSFWETFYNNYKDDINTINYEKENKKIKGKKKSSLKDDIILKMKDIFINYAIDKGITINKNEIEIILILLRRLMFKTGGDLTKLEINKLANKIHDYNPCGKYRDYIKYSVFGLRSKEKEIEEHINKCKSCKLYKDYISESKTARERRNKNVLKKYINTNPYIDENKEILTEKEYIKQADITYFKKQFRNNPCETNFYYLISAYIKNGNKKHAKELLKEGFNFDLYKDKAFMEKALIYLQEEN